MIQADGITVEERHFKGRTRILNFGMGFSPGL
jgi:hypothetical protein